jgi:rhamnosyltransferase
MNENVLACITAYYPGPEFENICRIISQQTGLLLIVDNSVEGNLSSQGINFTPNTLVVCNRNKDAISGALNTALKYARDHDFEYLHIFDQDTVPPEDITGNLIPAFQTDPKAVIVSPRFLNSSTNFPGRVLLNVKKWKVKNTWPAADIGMISALFTISSASLLHIKRLPQDMFYDRRLFIDNCDVDFCLFLRNEGFEILVDTSICVIHGIGSRKKGGGRWSATNYSPLRKQLSSKNRVIIWRRYRTTYPGYILSDMFIFLLDTGRTLVFENSRFTKFGAICKGIWQGLKEKNIAQRTK